jgi:hypothetical protein
LIKYFLVGKITGIRYDPLAYASEVNATGPTLNEKEVFKKCLFSGRAFKQYESAGHLCCKQTKALKNALQCSSSFGGNLFSLTWERSLLFKACEEKIFRRPHFRKFKKENTVMSRAQDETV